MCFLLIILKRLSTNADLEQTRDDCELLSKVLDDWTLPQDKVLMTNDGYNKEFIHISKHWEQYLCKYAQNKIIHRCGYRSYNSGNLQTSERRSERQKSKNVFVIKHRNQKTFDINRMVFADGRSFRIGLKELLDISGITVHQSTTMTLSLLTGKNITSFQSSSCEQTVNLHRLNETLTSQNYLNLFLMIMLKHSSHWKVTRREVLTMMVSRKVPNV